MPFNMFYFYHIFVYYQKIVAKVCIICKRICIFAKIIIRNYFYYNMKYADYIVQIEIDSLWSGKKHIVWDLDPKVNILSGINGEGKSTILNKVVKGLLGGGEFPSHLIKGVHVKVEPEEAKWIRFDVIRSFDRPLISADLISKVGDLTVTTELDLQLYQLQRKYLDYQVNIGNRIIAVLQSGAPDAAQKAAEISAPKKRFQDLMDDLFSETGKKLQRDSNEIRFSQIGETLLPYQLSSGEKQILAILLTTLIEDQQHYVLFMDEPEVSLHIEWQKRLIDMILELNPNVQIILTTHSPAVIMNGWADRVTEVSEITDQKPKNE
jgi:ABC-type glutathione transport system ATPase component